MHHEDQTEVLVVGGGPVGMFTAILLSEAGLQVRVIDEQCRTAVHSYACALHPRTLQLLDEIGLASAVLSLGYRIETVGFYQGQSRQAEMNLLKLPVDFPFVLVLPQSALEGLLEQHLRQRCHIQVEWNHRLSDLRAADQKVLATIDRLAGTVTGYSVPTWELTVEKQSQIAANFVVGADGHDSLVRRLLGIPYEPLGELETFAVYEFESDRQFGPELHVVLEEATTSVLWPLPDKRLRWNFQTARSQVAPAEFPAKERGLYWFYNEKSNQALCDQVHRLVAERAPWFSGQVGEVEWSLEVRFGSCLAGALGRDRCWLVGDAAHQTGPVGMQSMNVGMAEAQDLAAKLKEILRDQADGRLLDAYNQDCRRHWQRLLGVQGAVVPTDSAKAWTKARAARMLSCIPATGPDLLPLLQQVGLELRERTA